MKRILLVHNRYRHTGGEEAVFHNEVQLLRSAGHEVREYLDDNDRVGKELNYFRLGAETIWNDPSRKNLRTVLMAFRPSVVHFHNIFPLLSPSVYWACYEFGVPVVQTLHNYRLLCLSGMFMRKDRVCEDCLTGPVKWRGIVHACYRESRLATTAVAAMVSVHHLLGTWKNKVTQYIALSKFSRAKFIEGGLPAEKIVVKPNFVPFDPGIRETTGDFALFVGRLSAEKGVDFLLDAWSMAKPAIPLRIVGEGPLRSSLEEKKELLNLGNIVFAGSLVRRLVFGAMKQARFVVCSNRSYENFPLVIAEAYACGIPVLAPRLGVMSEIVRDGVTGVQFEPDSKEDFAAKIEWAWTHNERMEEMGRAARAEYEAMYTAEHNYQTLMQIYENAASFH